MNGDTTEIERRFFQLTLLVKDRMSRALADVDTRLSPVQVMILRRLCEVGDQTQNEISLGLGRDKSQIAKLIKDLERKGLVRRKPHPEDRRSNVVSPAPTVCRMVADIAARERQLVAAMLDGVSPEDRAAFSRLLAQMTRNLADHA